MSHHSDPLAASNCLNNADDVAQSDTADTSIPSHSPPSDHHDDDVITHLLASEHHHMPHQHHLRQPAVVNVRLDSINWILKVNAHYYFKPVTAFLSINYFDRFLSLHSLSANGWPYQLLAVACLSLAAKMEEPYVPLLIDLQVCEPSYVFQPKTIQRMELLVMVNLNWQLRAVTPFDYLHYFISKLFGSQPGPLSDIESLSSDLIINTTQVVDFLGFAPSGVAAAAVICAAGESVDLPEAFYERVNKEMVRSCHQIMEEYLVDTCPDQKVRRPVEMEPAAPSSPSGVLDAAACVSCDTRSGNPAAEPDNKRPRSSAPDVQDPQQ